MTQWSLQMQILLQKQRASRQSVDTNDQVNKIVEYHNIPKLHNNTRHYIVVRECNNNSDIEKIFVSDV